MRRRSRARLLALPLLAGLLLLACSGEADKPLASFQGDGFSVLMPGKPKRSEQTANNQNGPVKIVLYTSESRDKAYLVGYTDIPTSLEVDLAGAVKGAADGVKGTAQDEVATTHQGFPARDARISHASDGNGNQGTAFLRVIHAGNRLYQLQYIQDGKDVKAPPPEYPQFLDSLKIG